MDDVKPTPFDLRLAAALREIASQRRDAARSYREIDCPGLATQIEAWADEAEAGAAELEGPTSTGEEVPDE